MKTKLLFTVLLLVAFLENTYSQDYLAMLNNPSWILKDFVSCCRPSETKTIQAGEDIDIGSYTYKKFVDPFTNPGSSNHVVYLREDVDARKVYSLVNGEDIVLYDFSLSSGDVYEDYTVNTDHININGVDHKRIILSRYSEEFQITFTQTWIEGVGSPAHPFRPAFNMYNGLSGSGGHRINLVCSFQDGQHVYGNADCALEFLGTDENVISNPQISFAPNPVVNEITIHSDLALQNASVKLYNLQGQLVREINNLSGNKITVSKGNLSTGLYFVQLLENNKLIKGTKLMVQ